MHGLKFSYLTQDGRTPLMISAQEGHDSVVTLLLDAEADVALVDKVRLNDDMRYVRSIRYFDTAYHYATSLHIVSYHIVSYCIYIEPT